MGSIYPCFVQFWGERDVLGAVSSSPPTLWDVPALCAPCFLCCDKFMQTGGFRSECTTPSHSQTLGNFLSQASIPSPTFARTCRSENRNFAISFAKPYFDSPAHCIRKLFWPKIRRFARHFVGKIYKQFFGRVKVCICIHSRVLATAVHSGRCTSQTCV